MTFNNKMTDVFQSTPPRGRRLMCMYQNTVNFHFNPRLREGGDVLINFVTLFYFISIHASAREATEDLSVVLLIFSISIHASAREATLSVG